MTELVEQVGHAVVMVQELMPGTAVDRLDGHTLNQALQLNERQAGLLDDRPDIPAARLYLQDDGPGFCLHEPLRQFSRRAAALERRIRTIREPEPGPDIVHFDFHPGNLLAQGGLITGVIDWDGAARGDRRRDLVTLRFGVAGQSLQARALDDVLDRIPADELEPLWAHVSLRLTDWAIRHHTDQIVHQWLNLAGQRL